MDDIVAAVRSGVSLVQVVGQHIPLRKQGRELWGLCPFHEEKTPSFHVNEQKQSWFCFGCRKGGDVFAFIELVEKTDFPGALRILAEMANVELPEHRAGDRERSQLRRRLIELNGLAAQYYEYVLHQLPAGEPGRELLARREVGGQTARLFGLGYAPGGSSLAAFLHSRGKSAADAGAAGLVRRTGQDFFQHRLVVPIRDERGQVVAFTGRTIMPGRRPKYINSPDTVAYRKGQVLFGLDLARAEIEERGCAILVEGQFDVISCHQCGIRNAVGSSGTGVTADQLALVRRFTTDIVVVFDNDPAGRAATHRAVVLGHQCGLRSRVSRLAIAGQDPEQYVRADGSLADLVASAAPGWEAMIRDALEGLDLTAPRDREIGVQRAKGVLNLIGPDTAGQAIYGEVAAQLLRIDAHLLLPPRRASLDDTRVADTLSQTLSFLQAQAASPARDKVIERLRQLMRQPMKTPERDSDPPVLERLPPPLQARPTPPNGRSSPVTAPCLSAARERALSPPGTN